MHHLVEHLTVTANNLKHSICQCGITAACGEASAMLDGNTHCRFGNQQDSYCNPYVRTASGGGDLFK